MAEYIEKGNAINAVFEAFADGRSAYVALEAIPAADVVPVRHGEWIGYPECLKYENAYSDDHIICSVCTACFSIIDNCTETFNYCPNCGARMDGEA